MAANRIESENNYFYYLGILGVNCFKDYQFLQLCDKKGDYYPWTIILGDNGTGKTTLLRILDRMQPSGLTKTEYDYFPLIWSYNNFLREKIVEIKLNLKNEKDSKFFKFKRNDNDDNGVMSNNGNNKFPFMISYGASRRMSKTPTLSRSEEGNLKLTSLFDETLNLINVEEWLLQKYTKSLLFETKSNNKFEKEYLIVKSLLVNFLPDVKDVRVKSVNEKNSELIIEVETDLGWVNLRDLSFGYQTITALLVDIASKMMEQYPETENPLEKPVVILIDEIDLHLHPKWQRTVINKLSHHFPKAQFIVTAHSPLIVQAAQDRNANIVVCRKEGDKVVIDNNPESVKGWRIDQILTSDLFEVESPRSKETQKAVDDYIKLKGKKNLAKSDLDKLESLTPLVQEVYGQGKEETELDIKLKKFAEKYLK